MTALRRWLPVAMVAVSCLVASSSSLALDIRATHGWAHPAPDATASAAPAAPLEVWLRGPFGTVRAGTVSEPAAAAPYGRALDTFVRRAPLRLDGDVVASAFRVDIVTRPTAGAAATEALSDDDLAFEGPDNPGRQVIVATITAPGGEVDEAAWLVDVPDREPPADGLYDIPAPEVIVESSGGQASGQLGDGCHVYLCVEAGPVSVLETLTPLRIGVGEVPTVRLSDESAITAWEGRLTPIGRAKPRARDAAGQLPDTSEAVVALAGLQPPGPGSWRLDLEVTLDRERGWLRTAYRLEAEPLPTSSDDAGQPYAPAAPTPSAGTAG